MFLDHFWRILAPRILRHFPNVFPFATISNISVDWFFCGLRHAIQARKPSPVKLHETDGVRLLKGHFVGKHNKHVVYGEIEARPEIDATFLVEDAMLFEWGLCDCSSDSCISLKNNYHISQFLCIYYSSFRLMATALVRFLLIFQPLRSRARMPYVSHRSHFGTVQSCAFFKNQVHYENLQDFVV